MGLTGGDTAPQRLAVAKKPAGPQNRTVYPFSLSVLWPVAVHTSMFICKVSLLQPFPHSDPRGAPPDSWQRKTFHPLLWIYSGQSPRPHSGPPRNPCALHNGFQHITTTRRVFSEHAHPGLLTEQPKLMRERRVSLRSFFTLLFRNF